MIDEQLKDPLPSGHFTYTGPPVLFEDNHLIAVNKRPSDIVQTDKTLDTPMTSAITEYLRYTYQKPGNVFLGVIHRLDRPVSGVVLFAKTSKALMRMNDMFKHREITKKYFPMRTRLPANTSAEKSEFPSRQIERFPKHQQSPSRARGKKI